MPSLSCRTRRSALPLLALALIAGPAPLAAAEPALSPAEIVAAAPAGEWAAIAPDDLLVMDLVPDVAGRARRVVIQLLPPPFSQGWIGNIRKLAAAHWWDGLSINRVQDNYVVQWGDAEGEDKTRARPLPPGLQGVKESAYTVDQIDLVLAVFQQERTPDSERDTRAGLAAIGKQRPAGNGPADYRSTRSPQHPEGWHERDAYAGWTQVYQGWPLASDGAKGPDARFWPVHCYGAVGVGRNMPPDTGTGAELYTVIGTPPRHLDRNIAVVGRVIEGIELLSALPRGTGPLGFYLTPAERTGIRSIRLGSEVPDLPRFQYLSTESASFARYAEARANRRDAFFIYPAGGVDICNLPVPVRRMP